jgi:hypothetical protein
MDFVHLLNIMKLQDEFQFHQAIMEDNCWPCTSAGANFDTSSTKGLADRFLCLSFYLMSEADSTFRNITIL